MPKSIRKFRATKWFHPYLGDKEWVRKKHKKYPTGRGKCTLTDTGPGVYIIKGKVHGKIKIIYIGMSSTDVKKALYRHFQKWTDCRHPKNPDRYYVERVTYHMKDDFCNKEYLCKVIFTDNSESAACLEQDMITKIQPRDNKLKIRTYEEQKYKIANQKFNESIITDANNPFGLKKYPTTDEDAPF